jgi:hypothetical protein
LNLLHSGVVGTHSVDSFNAITLPSCSATEGQALTLRRNPGGAIKFVEKLMAKPAFQRRRRPAVQAQTTSRVYVLRQVAAKTEELAAEIRRDTIVGLVFASLLTLIGRIGLAVLPHDGSLAVLPGTIVIAGDRRPSIVETACLVSASSRTYDIERSFNCMPCISVVSWCKTAKLEIGNPAWPD